MYHSFQSIFMTQTINNLNSERWAGHVIMQWRDEKFMQNFKWRTWREETTWAT